MDLQDLRKFLIEFQDYLAPKLDTYEQAIYLYIFRHSKLEGKDEAVVPFKSARNRLACGVGEGGKPMSESSAQKKLQSLHEKGAIKILRTTHAGRALRLYLPHEISGVIPSAPPEVEPDIDLMDFFIVPENRLLLLKRENYRCFYTLQKLDEANFVVDHVVSRPLGTNCYRNCVAASREANNKKGAMPADDFLRKLFRDGFLNEAEFQDRMHHLDLLKSGELKPQLL